MVKRALSSLALIALCATAAFAASTPAPKLPDKPLPAEVAFVTSVQTELAKSFGTPEAAEKAGFFRYTNEDKTGAISWVNPAWWNSTDVNHPSQLWYDVHGNLLGADYSVPMSQSATKPSKWGLNPERWFKFGAHVHYVYKDAAGHLVYGHAMRTKKFTDAGGDLSNPTAATIVKLGLVKDASQVVHVFAFPDLWDTEIWAKPNPKGAFADSNPLVKPSTMAGKSMNM